jgi:hypothetical protein
LKDVSIDQLGTADGLDAVTSEFHSPESWSSEDSASLLDKLNLWSLLDKLDLWSLSDQLNLLDCWGLNNGTDLWNLLDKLWCLNNGADLWDLLDKLLLDKLWCLNNGANLWNLLDYLLDKLWGLNSNGTELWDLLDLDGLNHWGSLNNLWDSSKSDLWLVNDNLLLDDGGLWSSNRGASQEGGSQSWTGSNANSWSGS